MDLINLIFYITMFIIGSLLGSFFTLAVYRIPLKQDITHERSYCPNCNHRLEFLDLIPIFSYIFLGGKCRYCKQKIRPRYLILEISSGLVFLFFMISLRFNFYTIEIKKIIYLLFGILYISTLFIIGGIDKEHHDISKPVVIFGLIVETIYMIYLYIITNSIYKYVIYLILIALMLILTLTKIYNKKYLIQIIILLLFITIATDFRITVISSIISTLIAIIKILVTKEKINIPLGFYLCFSSVAVLILQNFI